MMRGLLTGLVTTLLLAGCGSTAGGGSPGAPQPASAKPTGAVGPLENYSGGSGSDSAGSMADAATGIGGQAGAPMQTDVAGGSAGALDAPMPSGGSSGIAGVGIAGATGIASGGAAGSSGIDGASGADTTGGAGGSGGTVCQVGGASGNGSDFSDCGCSDGYVIAGSGKPTPPVTFTAPLLVKWSFANGLCPQNSTVAIKITNRTISCDADYQSGPTWTCSASGLGSQLAFAIPQAIGDQVTFDVVYMPAYGAPYPGQVTGYSWTHIHSLPVANGQSTMIDLSFPALPVGSQLAQATVTESAN